MFDFIKRLFVCKRAYLTALRPCPCCGGRHTRFKPAGLVDLFNHIICDDCGFTIEHGLADRLIENWEQIPRKKEDNHD